MTELDWANVDLEHISRPAWNKIVGKAEEMKVLAEKVHNLRIKTGDLELDDDYENYMARYARYIDLLRLVAPTYIAGLADAVHNEAMQLEVQLEKLWRDESGNGDEFSSVSGRYVRLLDQYQILKGKEISSETG